MTSEHTDLTAITDDAPVRRFGEEVLMDYVTGTLDEATALMVAAHLDLCPASRGIVDMMTEVGGTVLADAQPVALGAGALESVLAMLDDTPQETGAQVHDPDLALLPAEVRDRAQAQLAGNAKWSFVTPGVRALDLGFARPVAADGASVGEVKLYRIEPGKGVPTHTHKGQEVTLVLTGAFADGHDRYGPGDISVASPDVTHRPVAEKDAVCFALAITDAPLQLTGALGLVQRALSVSGGAGGTGGAAH
ncbi:ChrR family anti-sigma-E factor [Pyruvatibacter sp.]|uniref:ChrR family anti-sigma-E factor n=1 Tax=Pyruvatibacter sp. TaxID=1981328 RepID=UPI0032EADCAF